MKENHPSPKIYRILRSIVKWLLGGVALLLVLLLLLVIALQFPSVQTRITGKIVDYYSERTGTIMQVDKVSIRFPTTVAINDIYLEDQQGDTLLFAGRIRLKVNIPGLLRNRLQVDDISLRHVYANILRLQPDTLFNYQFIVDSFAGNKDDDTVETVQQTTTEEKDAMEMNLGKISLADVRIRFADHLGGIDLSVHLGELGTRVNRFDPGLFAYHVDHTSIKNTLVDLHMSQPSREKPPSSKESPDMDLMLPHLELENFSFNMHSADGALMALHVPGLDIETRSFDLGQNLVHLDRLAAHGVTFEMQTPPSLSTEVVENKGDDFNFRWGEVFEWDIEVASLKMTFDRLAMIPLGNNSSSREFDPKNMTFTDLQLDVADVIVNSRAIVMNLDLLTATHASGFVLEELSADIALEQTMRVENFTLLTGKSRLRLDLISDMNPLDFSMHALELAHLDLEIEEGILASDLRFFYPPLVGYMAMAGDPENIKFLVNVQGAIADLQVDRFDLEIPELLAASFHGQIKGLPEQDKLFMNLSEINLGMRPARIMAMLPDSLQLQGMVLPDTLSLSGFFSGSMQAFQTKLAMASSMGDLHLEGSYADDGQGIPSYQAQIELLDIDAGEILQQQEIFGTLTASIALEGRGLEPETADGTFDLEVKNATFNQYTYNDLKINGELREGMLTALLEYEDGNLSLAANQQVWFGENTRVKLHWKLGQVNLQALNFSEELMLIRGEISGDMNLVTQDFAQGQIQITGIEVFHDNEAFSMANMTVETELLDRQYNLHLKSPVLQADYSGNISPLAVPAVIAGHLNSYLADPIVTDTLNGSRKHFGIALTVYPSDLLSGLLMPELSFPEPLRLTADFDSNTSVLSLEAAMRQLTFGNIRLDGIDLAANTDPGKSTFSANLGSIEMGNLLLTSFLLEGNLADSIINFTLAFDDQFKERWLTIPATLKTLKEGWQLALDTDLIINREPWQASPGNYVVFGQQMLYANNLKLEREGGFLLINSLRDEPDGHDDVFQQEALPLNITFNEFDLHEFSLLTEHSLAGGLFNGFITLQDIYSDFAFTADLTVKDFSFRGDTLGNVAIQASNPQPDFFKVYALISGSGNHIELTGNYLTGDDPSLEVDLKLEQVNLSTVEGLMAGEITGLSGQLTGALAIRGTTSNPILEGNLGFEDVGLHVDYLSTAFTIPRESITFTRNNIQFSTFTLVDERKGSASLDGSIDIADLSDIGFNLTLKTDNFLMLDVPEGENELFSGSLLVGSDLRIRGDMVSPVVDGRLSLNEGSRFAFIIPQRSPEAVGADGVVFFITPTDTLFQDMIVPEGPAMATTVPFQNLDLSVNLEVDPKTELRIVIDQAAGDHLELTGGGVLSFGIDPGGRMSLTGRYEIDGGSYLLTFYDAIRRNFTIQKGSTIQWRGDPMDALVDITAQFSVRTSARELLISSMEDGATEAGTLRQQFPFLVSLKMEGDLEEPQISFQINLPPEHQDALQGRVQTRLTELNQTESELNKQVFALLVLGNFLHENPFETIGAGPGLSATARSSASRILSQQLNKLSERYVRGLNVSFDVESYEDYTTGDPEGRTELQMEVSKAFLDERLRVTVGGNIELEDETRRESTAGEIAGDFLLEYLLNEDGNLVLKAFRKKNYGDLFNGQVFETGVSIMFTRSYNVFREIFRRKALPAPQPAAAGTIPEIDTQNQ